MSKELEAFVRLEQNSKRYKGRKEDLDTIFTTLKNYEKQDNLIKIIKETIEFGIKDNKVEVSEKGDVSLSGTIGLILRKELDKKERILFRDWILEACFPRELKALKIIEEKRVNVEYFLYTFEDWKDITYEQWIFYYYENGYFIQGEEDFTTNRLTKEEFDLLKEVLL